MQDITFDPTRDPSGPMRVLSTPRLIRDRRSDQMVSVVERRADGVAGARGPTCLMYTSELGFTRVWDYPAHWLNLSDVELLALPNRRYRQSRSA